jgi:hypothetical protein
MRTDELESDLKALAAPQAEDERLRIAIRTTLGDQRRVRPKVGRRRRPLLGLAAVSAAALAAAGALLIGTSGVAPSSANAAILAHVVRAISPPANMIVHVKEVGAQDGGTQVSVEWWQETNPPFAIRLIKGTAGQQVVDAKGNAGGGQVESAADGTTSTEYDAGTNTISERPDSTSPTLIDPVESVRAGLTQGTAQVAGVVTIDGRSLYEIALPDGVIGYFDHADYRPVYLDNPQRDGSVVRTRVTTYEELSTTPENKLLLSISAQHPRASVDTAPPPESGKQK